MIKLAQEAQVSVSTIKRFESELPQGVATSTISLMPSALVQSGIESLADEGVRLRPAPR